MGILWFVYPEQYAGDRISESVKVQKPSLQKSFLLIPEQQTSEETFQHCIPMFTGLSKWPESSSNPAGKLRFVYQKVRHSHNSCVSARRFARKRTTYASSNKIRNES